MKRINKSHQPQELQQWRAANVAMPQNLRYGRASFPMDAVLSALLHEQGYLCAYTLKRIDGVGAHIEHLKPQSRCLAEDAERRTNQGHCEHEDVDWRNMVACCPTPNAPRPDYGAIVKDDWWDKALFVSPLAQNCEQRFKYAQDGSVAPAVDSDDAARETIKRLGLNDKKLQELRHNAMLRAGIHRKSPNPICSIAQVQRLVQNWQVRYADRSFTEFCTVMIQAANAHLEWVNRRSLRKSAARGG